MIELKSIEEEAADCYAAFKDSKVGDWAVHIHHGAKCVEQFSEPPENRISYILSQKPEKECAIRLRFMRPITKEQAQDYEAKCAALYADYKAKCAALYADYEAKCAALNADYNAQRAALDADYNAKRAPLINADYEAKRAPLDADYKAKHDALDADYEAQRAPLDADYNAKRDALHSSFFSPDCPWYGHTLFPESI